MSYSKAISPTHHNNKEHVLIPSQIHDLAFLSSVRTIIDRLHSGEKEGEKEGEK